MTEPVDIPAKAGPRRKRRALAGFRLDREALKAFRARLRARGHTMQPTLEAWVKRWLEQNPPHAEDLGDEIQKGQEEIRRLIELLSRKGPPTQG